MLIILSMSACQFSFSLLNCVRVETIDSYGCRQNLHADVQCVVTMATVTMPDFPHVARDVV